MITDHHECLNAVLLSNVEGEAMEGCVLKKKIYARRLYLILILSMFSSKTIS